MRHIQVRELPPKRDAYQFDGTIGSYETIRNAVESRRNSPLAEVYFRPANPHQKEPALVLVMGEGVRMHLFPEDWLVWSGTTWMTHTDEGLKEWFEEVPDDGEI